MTLDSLRVLPNNIEAEQSVLGSIIADNTVISEVSQILNGDEFYRESHKTLYKTMMELFDRDEPIDIVTLVDTLRTKGELEIVGGVSYLSDLAMSVPSTANVKAYAKIVQDKYALRRLIEASNHLIENCYNKQDDVDEVLSLAEKSIFDISQKNNHSDFEHLSTIIAKSFDEIEKICKNKGELTGIPSGFTDLDSKTSGFQNGDMILVAARPSMGKTAFALNIASYAALRAGKSVAIFSLEMSKIQLAYRMLCAEANIDMQKLRTGDLNDEDWIRLARAAGPMAGSKIFIDDTAAASVTEIRSKCRKLKIEHGLDLIIIDYMQLMTSNKRAENRQQEVSEISRSLKALAKEMNAPVIALSQLSRAPEVRADHRPMLSDLRESGSIEQDADIVMFLYRDDYYNKETDKKNISEVIIAKQRNGPTGTVELAWIGQYTKFGNLDRYHNE